MTVAPVLPIPPERSEWTVDDLGDLPEDLPYELVSGRLIVPSPTALHQDLCVELLLALRVNCPPDYLVSIDLSMRIDRRNESRPDVVATHTEDLFVSERPWKVSVDLPALTARRAGLLARDEE
ncbi:Uma2 family endonuclease [Micromonospora sp. Llam7]|uniref:Uma2 family endonuclease n=1 Tax=Micromonospora tarapacensis TaxID=2835305 RepID=UPI001C834917|nr:Uma2 family endonuclease [Micromonospora tarapacensis]MBX7268484.1 Uma2 family endonuclease [Micromonospora tarapacensis]